jgi:hypothetical protein
MAESKILNEARNGNVKAIEHLLNQSLKGRKVTARVKHSGELLKIELRALDTTPDQSLGSLVYQGLSKIQPKGFTKFYVQAEPIGKGATWTEEWSIGDAQPQIISAPNKRSKLPTSWIVGIGSGIFLLYGAGIILSAGFADPGEEYVVEARELVDEGVSARQAGNLSRAASKYESAIATLREVPESSKRYESAQKSIEGYSKILDNINSSKKSAERKPTTPQEQFSDLLQLKTPGVVATATVKDMDANYIMRSCSEFARFSSSLGIDGTVSRLSNELRIQQGYDDKLADNVATGIVEACLAWERGERPSID